MKSPFQSLAACSAVVVLAGVVLVASGCGSTSSPTGPSTSPAAPASGLVTIFITGGVSSPNPLTVKVGQQVNWKNNDSIAHTATSGSFDTGSIPPLSAHDNPVTMNTVGTISFHCTIHSGENGSIIVQP